MSGCARERARDESDPASHAAPELRVWRSFSGNNRGERILVARFASVDDARGYLHAVGPGCAAGQPYEAPWRALLAAEGVGDDEAVGTMPDTLVAIGRTVVGALTG